MLASNTLSAQLKHDYTWITGYCSNCTEEHPKFGTTIFDFNNDTLNIFRENSIYMDFQATDASICDTNGDLLFYTNGCNIENTEHEVMPGGARINDNEGWDVRCGNDGEYTVNKGAMILPLPGSDQIFYLFHFPLVKTPSGVKVHELRYTVVDMSGDGGLGEVTEKDAVAFRDTLHSSFLAAVKHANGEDWWLVMPKTDTNLYFRVLFTAGGIESIATQSFGAPIHPYGLGSGQAVFSPDGTMYANYSDRDQARLYDFDNSTGLLSNFRQLFIRDTLGAGGVTFSPNSRYLYVSSKRQLHQFDTQAADVQASRTLISDYDGETVEGWKTFYFTMQLAPDCRIYMIASNGVPSMHVINHPDRAGIACGFVQNGVRLPTFNAFSQPNFPNYRLGSPYYVCDSTIELVTASQPVLPPPVEVRLWPNPSSGEVRLALPAPLRREGRLRLYDMVGQRVFDMVLASGQTEFNTGLDGLGNGLYFWEAVAEGRRIGKGKVVVAR